MKLAGALYGIGGGMISGGILNLIYGIKFGIPHRDLTYVIFGVVNLMVGSYLFVKAIKRHDKARNEKFWHGGK